MDQLDYYQFLKYVQKALLNELPGKHAHTLLMPETVHNNRYEIFDKERYKNAAVLIICYKKNGKWHIVLMQRPVYPGKHSGQISLPGGKYEPEHDNDLQDTALRETLEEIGVAVKVDEVQGELTDIYIPVSYFRVKPFISVIDYKPVFIPDPTEVSEIIEVPLEELMNIHQKLIKNELLFDGQFPHYYIQGKEIVRDPFFINP